MGDTNILIETLIQTMHQNFKWNNSNTGYQLPLNTLMQKQSIHLIKLYHITFYLKTFQASMMIIAEKTVTVKNVTDIYSILPNLLSRGIKKSSSRAITQPNLKDKKNSLICH